MDRVAQGIDVILRQAWRSERWFALLVRGRSAACPRGSFQMEADGPAAGPPRESRFGDCAPDALPARRH